MSHNQPKHYDKAADVDVRSLPLRGRSIGAWCSVGEPGASTGNEQTLTWVLSGDGEGQDGVLLPGARELNRPVVYVSYTLDGHQGTLRRFDSFTPEPFSLLSFSGTSAGQARVLVGTLFGRTSPVDTPQPLVGAELRIYPGAEFVFMVDPHLSYGVVALTEGIVVENIALEPATVGVPQAGTQTIHIVNTSEETAGAIVLGGAPTDPATHPRPTVE